MKNLLTLTALGVVLFTGCGGDTNNNASELKNENDSLKMEIESLKQAAGVVALAAPVTTSPLPLPLLKAGIKKFQDESSIKIPSGWVFTEAGLQAMLSHVVGGKEIVGIIAYPMKSGDTLQIALVPYYEEGNPKVKKHFDVESDLNAYDFSDIIPSRDGKYYGASNDGFLGAKREICEYKSKTCVTK